MSGASSVRRVSGAATPIEARRHEELLRAWAALERERARLGGECVDVSFAIAARVVGEAARVDRAVTLRALGDALAMHGEVAAVLVRAHADDVPACEAALAGGPFAYAVAADAAVAPGGVIVESVRGTVDARVEVRLSRLRALLEGGA